MGEEKISYEDVCEPYEEEIKTTQNVEQCEDKPYTNCTGSVEVEMDRVCFNVDELLCSLQQKTDYEAVQERYQVQKCTTLMDRVCDTNYNLDVVTEDDYQCIDLESEHCEDVEVAVNDVVCKYTFKFDCKKPKRGEGGYGMEKACTKEPEAKRYSYHKDCKKVPREICDMVERKRVAPNCVTEYRPKCEFVPFVKSAGPVTKQYCYKQERVTMEEVCDKKLGVEFL